MKRTRTNVRLVLATSFLWCCTLVPLNTSRAELVRIDRFEEMVPGPLVGPKGELPEHGVSERQIGDFAR